MVPRSGLELSEQGACPFHRKNTKALVSKGHGHELDAALLRLGCMLLICPHLNAYIRSRGVKRNPRGQPNTHIFRPPSFRGAEGDLQTHGHQQAASPGTYAASLNDTKQGWYPNPQTARGKTPSSPSTSSPEPLQHQGFGRHDLQGPSGSESLIQAGTQEQYQSKV